MNHLCPIDKNTPQLELEEANKLLAKLPEGWRINDSGHLYKEYKFKDFIAPLNFVNRIAIIAEEDAHHPDITISWGKCTIEIWSHVINGLSKNDFTLASKIEELL